MNIPAFKMFDDDKVKGLISENANWVMRKSDGYTEMWGKTRDDDMLMSPVPVILDCEVTTKCAGPGGVPCPFCYKANGPKGKNMSFETFKTIINKMKFVTQVAFGADAQGTANPDLFAMMAYARELGIIPNITIADIDDRTADKLALYCGAAAVSRYKDKDLCYDSIKKLTDRGMTQVNMHFMLANETYEDLLETLDDIKKDHRLAKLNAIVILSLKKKGRGVGYTKVSQEGFGFLVNRMLRMNIPFGFDSCSARKFEKAVSNYPNAEKMITMSVPCESTLESSYVDVNGDFFPCSFTEGSPDWKTGISVLECNDFIKDIWYSERTQGFRDKLIANCRNCPIYEV